MIGETFMHLKIILNKKPSHKHCSQLIKPRRAVQDIWQDPQWTSRECANMREAGVECPLEINYCFKMTKYCVIKQLTLGQPMKTQRSQMSFTASNQTNERPQKGTVRNACWL